MRGRWAAGIVPRNFCWIIKDHLAVSERPGGYAPNHRKVRRQEELLWLRAQGFTRVVSLLGSTHNLHAYEELGLEWSRFPMPAPSETRNVLAELYPSLHGWLRNGERLLLHQEELGDSVMGVVAGYLLWSEILSDGPRAITAMEQLLRRQMGTVGRMIVAAVDELPPVGSFASADNHQAGALEQTPGRPGNEVAEAGEAPTELEGEAGKAAGEPRGEEGHPEGATPVDLAKAAAEREGENGLILAEAPGETGGSAAPQGHGAGRAEPLLVVEGEEQAAGPS
ncbi:MAG: hypothetical protein ACLP36_14405 [Acidimicrobiales bacterium]